LWEREGDTIVQTVFQQSDTDCRFIVGNVSCINFPFPVLGVVDEGTRVTHIMRSGKFRLLSNSTPNRSVEYLLLDLNLF